MGTVGMDGVLMLILMFPILMLMLMLKVYVIHPILGSSIRQPLPGELEGIRGQYEGTPVEPSLPDSSDVDSLSFSDRFVYLCTVAEQRAG